MSSLTISCCKSLVLVTKNVSLRWGKLGRTWWGWGGVPHRRRGEVWSSWWRWWEEQEVDLKWWFDFAVVKGAGRLWEERQ